MAESESKQVPPQCQIGRLSRFRRSSLRLFRQRPTLSAVSSSSIILAISGGVTDLAFNVVGYTWQIINCFWTASYSLTLRRVMDTAKQETKYGILNEFYMVLLNNTLSLPLGLLLIFVFSEVEYLFRTPLLRMPSFSMVMMFSGVLGLVISFTSMWFLHQTGTTTYSLVGSLNKIPLSDVGILLFHVPTSLENSASILFGKLLPILHKATFEIRYNTLLNQFELTLHVNRFSMDASRIGRLSASGIHPMKASSIYLIIYYGGYAVKICTSLLW